MNIIDKTTELTTRVPNARWLARCDEERGYFVHIHDDGQLTRDPVSGDWRYPNACLDYGSDLTALWDRLTAEYYAKHGISEYAVQ